MGGVTPAKIDSIDYVQIMTTGNAVDFGDLLRSESIGSSCIKWSWRFIMSDFRVDKITNRDGSAGTQICGISTFSGTSGMQHTKWSNRVSWWKRKRNIWWWI